jgi:hypothetical protein
LKNPKILDVIVRFILALLKQLTTERIENLSFFYGAKKGNPFAENGNIPLQLYGFISFQVF